jgi:ribosomal peptide maturation radical SAM protein 1
VTASSADIVLVVPPFAHLTWPALGVHVLQAVARRAGWSTEVVYGNVTYAARIGEVAYSRLCNAPGDWLLGERIFRAAAFGLPPIGGDEDAFFAHLTHPLSEGADATEYLDQLSDMTGETFAGSGIRFSREELLEHSRTAEAWADDLAAELAAGPARVIGASTSFDQTGAAIAVLQRVKALAPHKVTVLGGANCEGPMAHGVASLAGVDVICSGESEVVFLDVVAEAMAGNGPTGLRNGSPCTDLDGLPTPDYADWYAAIDTYLPELSGQLWVSYETSRGCWWGAKRHCTFCGLNGQGMGFRAKSPTRVLADLKALTHRTQHVSMTDNIMPHGFHKTLAPLMAAELPDLHVFYEQKANLNFDQVNGLMQAGIRVIQPGIESLSTPLLERMDKGVLARQNLALLRYARSVGMGVKWNLLYAFPGDSRDDYEPMTSLLPLIQHLCPPNALTHLSIDRFSPYFESSQRYGVSELKPWDAYGAVFPPSADLEQLAYHFKAKYDSGGRDAQDVLNTLYEQIRAWRKAWGGHPPGLHLASAGKGFSLYDTRGLGGGTYFSLSLQQARTVLLGGPIAQCKLANWAIRSKFAVELDGWCAPLATADVATWERLDLA